MGREFIFHASGAFCTGPGSRLLYGVNVKFCRAEGHPREMPEPKMHLGYRLAAHVVVY